MEGEREREEGECRRLEQKESNFVQWIWNFYRLDLTLTHPALSNFIGIKCVFVRVSFEMGRRRRRQRYVRQRSGFLLRCRFILTLCAFRMLMYP